jgi:hypothetical protein
LAGCQPLITARRWLFHLLPFPRLESDITDAVYLNWAVDGSSIAELLPPGVEPSLASGQTILTVLTYRHGHFGPAIAGPLRRLCPSPLQSNWRLYVGRVHGRAPEQPTVLFVQTVLGHGWLALGSRLFSDALPSHLPLAFEHGRTPDGYRTRITSGVGSAPELCAATRFARDRRLPPAFGRLFQSWEAAVEWLCRQDAAVAVLAGAPRLASARIRLAMDLASAEPLAFEPASFTSAWLRRFVGDDEPLCFAVPRLGLHVLGETLLGRPA